MRPSLLIVDVDNTLFDWVHAWYQAFTAMTGYLQDRTGMPFEAWCDAFRDAHRAAGTTGGTHGLAPALAAVGLRDAGWLQREATAVYLAAWQESLVPYQGVRETLAGLRAGGVRIVACTESDGRVTAARLAALGLSPFVGTVFGPVTMCPAANREIRALVRRADVPTLAVRVLPAGLRKPAADVLRLIVTECRARAASALSVGDHLARDVGMAADAGVPACWAAYGARRVDAEATLLDRVAHWTPEAVAPERALTPDALPMVARLDSFTDLVAVCDAPREGLAIHARARVS